MTASANSPRAHYIWIYVGTCVFLGSLALAPRLDGLMAWLLPISTGLGLLTRVLLFRDARRQAADESARNAESAR